jgi:hypothetical protein
MKHLALLCCAVAAQAASLISGPPAGWNAWAPRAEIAPRTFIDKIHYRTHAEPGSLAISGNSNPAAFGGWEYVASGIAPGKWYRLVGYYRQQGATNVRNQVLARLDWRRANGKRTGQPDYAWKSEPAGDWTRITLDAPAPP